MLSHKVFKEQMNSECTYAPVKVHSKPQTQIDFVSSSNYVMGKEGRKSAKMQERKVEY